MITYPISWLKYSLSVEKDPSYNRRLLFWCLNQNNTCTYDQTKLYSYYDLFFVSFFFNPTCWLVGSVSHAQAKYNNFNKKSQTLWSRGKLKLNRKTSILLKMNYNFNSNSIYNFNNHENTLKKNLDQNLRLDCNN